MPPPLRAVKIAPSIMCADLCRLGEEVKALEQIGADLIHFDLMDAHFVPNMPLGLAIIQQLRAHTGLPFDVHLMVEDNDFFIDQLAPIGVQQISVHVESALHLDRTLAKLHERGILAGVALCPATPLNAIEYVLERLDYILIMTVNPGFAGQKLVPAGLRKIADCRDWLDSHGVDIPIQVDGNVSFQHIPSMVAAGAEILVAGTSSVLHRGASREANMVKVRKAIREALNREEN